MALKSIFKFSSFLKEFVKKAPDQNPKVIQQLLKDNEGIHLCLKLIKKLQAAKD